MQTSPTHSKPAPPAKSTGTILDDSDFYPFGVERPVTSSSGNTYKFTGKERDAESGLDNFGARFNSSFTGRFMSPDPKHVSAHLSDPQTFNRYLYARNNPLQYIDPDGKDFEKAVQDLKTFLQSSSVKLSLKIGYEVKLKSGKVELKAGAAGGASVEMSVDKVKVSQSIGVGISASPTAGLQVGESKEISQTVVTVDNHGLHGAEKPETTTVDTIGGTTSAHRSGTDVGIGLEAPLAVAPVSVGAEFNTSTEGLAAFEDFFVQVKDSLKNPGPPPPPAAPTAAPTCGGTLPACPSSQK